MKKPEEQASAVTQTAEFPESALTTADSPRGELRSMCARMAARRKLRSSVETTRMETVFRNVSIVNNLKATSEGFWLGGNKNRVTRTDEMRAEY